MMMSLLLQAPGGIVLAADNGVRGGGALQRARGLLARVRGVGGVRGPRDCDRERGEGGASVVVARGDQGQAAE